MTKETRELKCIFDGRKSFYGKAKVIITEMGDVIRYELISYSTMVASIIKTGTSVVYNHNGVYSHTTSRHQREFFLQYAKELSYDEMQKIKKGGVLVKEW